VNTEISVIKLVRDWKAEFVPKYRIHCVNLYFGVTDIITAHVALQLLARYKKNITFYQNPPNSARYERRTAQTDRQTDRFITSGQHSTDAYRAKYSLARL